MKLALSVRDRRAARKLELSKATYLKELKTLLCLKAEVDRARIMAHKHGRTDVATALLALADDYQHRISNLRSGVTE